MRIVSLLLLLPIGILACGDGTGFGTGGAGATLLASGSSAGASAGAGGTGAVDTGTTTETTATGTTSTVTGTTTTPTGSGGAGTGGSGTGGVGGDPFNTPVVCTSGTQYPGGNNADMAPGEACQSCHVLLGKATSKTFDVSGTVYPSAHEPDDCNGVSVAGATVVITDANNVDTVLPVNGVGNFYHQDLFGFAKIPLPAHVKVVHGGQTRKMIATITTGDCNSCHTEQGTQSAPGRIVLP